MIINFLIKTFFRKEAGKMAVIYATLIIKGNKALKDVPTVIKEQVRQILIDLDVPELANAE